MGLIWAPIVGAIAYRQKRNVWLGVLFGFLFGIISMIVYLIIGKKEPNN